MKGAIADHGGRRADHAEEALDDASRSSFLPEAEKSADEDDCEDDRAVHALTDDERQNGGDEQQDRHRAGELCRQEPYRVCMPTGSGQVGSVLGESVSVGLRLSPAHLLSSGAPPEPLRWARPTMRLRGRRSRQAPERSGRCGRCGWAGRRAAPRSAVEVACPQLMNYGLAKAWTTRVPRAWSGRGATSCDGTRRPRASASARRLMPSSIRRVMTSAAGSTSIIISFS